MNKVLSIILYLIIVCNSTSAQWNVGAAYKFKSAVPDKGVGINISRNLPVQLPNWGVSIRAELDLFRSSEIDSKNILKKYHSENYHIQVVTTFFTKNIYPYLGFGGGYSHQKINDLNKGGIILTFLTGLKLPLDTFFYPYVEVQGVNYFVDFNLSGKEISSFQIKGVVGVNIIIK